MWEIEGTDEFADWLRDLPRSDQVRVEAAIEYLERLGPGLGRPWADSLRGTKLKELVPRGGHLRILFRFDPRRTVILLLGGDKADSWDDWYRRNVPVAEGRFRDYLAELKDEGLIE